MNVIAEMDRYRKEVIEVSTWKHGIKGSISLQYFGQKEIQTAWMKKNFHDGVLLHFSRLIKFCKIQFLYAFEKLSLKAHFLITKYTDRVGLKHQT